MAIQFTIADSDIINLEYYFPTPVVDATNSNSNPVIAYVLGDYTAADARIWSISPDSSVESYWLRNSSNTPLPRIPVPTGVVRPQTSTVIGESGRRLRRVSSIGLLTENSGNYFLVIESTYIIIYISVSATPPTAAIRPIQSTLNGLLYNESNVDFNISLRASIYNSERLSSDITVVEDTNGFGIDLIRDIRPLGARAEVADIRVTDDGDSIITVLARGRVSDVGPTVYFRAILYRR